MLILFLMDTSASMNQRISNGMTLLDAAKAAIEHFVRLRSKHNPNDRYFLVTCEEGISGIRCGWHTGMKDQMNVFLQELKNLVAKDLSSIGIALKRSFDLLNQYRIQNGIDCYGVGRVPWFNEIANIILLTDGGALTTNTGVLESLSLPLNPTLPGSELTLEPFRWDQRLFSIVLQIPSTPVPVEPPRIDSKHILAPMSEVTGGNCQIVTSMKALLGAVESLLGRLYTGLVINLECATNPPPNKDIPSACLHKLMFIRPNVGGFWPIPEAYWPDPNMTSLMPRTAQPTIKFSTSDADPFIIDNFPFDKYELEQTSLTNYLATAKRGVCWQVFVPGSAGPNKLGEPFGFIKASSAHPTASLFVLPYNYPKLWPLLDDLVNVQKMAPSPKWRQEFERYLMSIPSYYHPYMRNALKRFGAPPIIPDHLDGQLPYPIVSYFKKLKQQSKLELDRMQTALKLAKDSSNPAPVIPTFKDSIKTAVTTHKSYHQLLSRDKNASIYRESSSGESMELETNLSDITPLASLHKNAFDIDRNDLLESIEKIRMHLKQPKLQNEDAKHMVPIQQMGVYEDVIKKREVLRDIDEDRKPRPVHLFGNPFRLPKTGQRFEVANIDEAEVEAESSVGEVAAKASAEPKIAVKPVKRKPPTPSYPQIPQKKPKISKPVATPVKQATVTPPPSPAHIPIDDGIIPPTTPPLTTTSPVANLAPKIVRNTPTEEDVVATLKPEPMKKIVSTASNMSYPAQVSGTVSQIVQKKTEATDKKMSPQPSPIPQQPQTMNSGNLSLKTDIIKVLRKPGKNYEEIFSKLKGLQGDIATKQAFVQEVIQEAKRFKKAILVQQLETYFKAIT